MTMDNGMRMMSAVLGIALGGMLWLAVPAGAAPAIGAAGAAGVREAASESTAVEQVRWVRRCWRNRWGHLRCQRGWRPGHCYGAPYYGPRFGLYRSGPRRHFRGGPRFRGYGFAPRRGPAFRSPGFRGRSVGGRMGGRR
jgi:hypothetical protein